MDYYVIKNSKQLYIRLNNSGQPVTCSESGKQLFDFSKAKNIHSCLPKPLKRMGFCVVQCNTKHEGVINSSDNYTISKEMEEWKTKFQVCDNIISESKKRIAELSILIHNVEGKILDIRHRIELENNKDMYKGYLLYVELRDTLRERRRLKDERLILGDVIKMNFSSFSAEAINRSIDGLVTRKYKFRERVMEDDNL